MPVARAATRLALAAVVVASGLSTLGPARAQADSPARAAAPATAAAPTTLPALPDWSPAPGCCSPRPTSRIVLGSPDRALAEVARTFAGDLRAERPRTAPMRPGFGVSRPGDVVLRLDHRRHELSEEGYALRVGDRMSITARTAAGAFYGTRTVLQLLRSGRSVPAGSTVDVPRYRERAVGVCACYTYNTDAWFERLIRDMAYVKLNYLHLELKVASRRYPGVNSFSYYTPAELTHLTALARAYHVTVVPEINSPGHIDPYLENYPQWQLTDHNGRRDPTRLDITNPDAVSFYLHLLDDELPLVPGPSWHMGADEYMLGSAYADYPQLLAYARARFGPHATAPDAYIDFINRVDAHVRARGRVLRIWNDGLTGATTVALRRDIIVEHWIGEPVTPQQLLDGGHQLVNASDALYYVRGGYGPDVAGLYQSDWRPTVFAGQTVRPGQPGLAGAELMIWPDNYGKETENTAQTNLFRPLRLLAQVSWAGQRPAESYPRFVARAERVGRAPGWGRGWVQPVRSGRYLIRGPHGALRIDGGRVTTGPVAVPWTLQSTSDGYYRITAADGRCLELTRGTANRLGVVEQPGAQPTLAACTAAPTQEWQLEPTAGGLRLVNAITQLTLAATRDGVEQQPRDRASAARWWLQSR